MSAQRRERLINLVQVLLSSQQALTKARLRDVIADYLNSPSDTAFERMFERDKETLRDMGINVQTVSMDAWHEDEFGYRLDRRRATLPPIELSAQELAVLNIAARVWDQAALGPAARTALRKLEALGPEGGGDPRLPRLIEPHFDSGDESFPALVKAITERRVVRFKYRKPGQVDVEERQIQPWRVVIRRGHSYVTGFDPDRMDARVFRLSRVVGDVTLDKDGDSYEIPADVDVLQVSSDVDPRPVQQAHVRVRPNTCHRLRLDASESPGADSPGAEIAGAEIAGAHEWDALVVEFQSPESFATLIAGFGSNAVVDAPRDLRDAVVERLRSAAGEFA